MSAESLATALDHDQFLVRAKILSFFGQKFHVFDPAGNVVLFCKLKAFKLKEDIQLFAGEAEQVPLMKIKCRSVIDFSAAYDVLDMTAGDGDSEGFSPGQTLEYAAHPEGGKKIGALRRKGFGSLFRDAWEILDAADQPIGTIQEDSSFKAFVRRFIESASMFMPQAYHGEVNGQRVFEMKQNFNPFVRKLNCDFTHDPQHLLDRRLGMAAAVLLMAVEGRQG